MSRKNMNFDCLLDKIDSVKHFYKNIHGWFNYSNIYNGAVLRFPSGSHFVEVGSWTGKSAAYMAVQIINSDKKIKFDCVDPWAYLGEGRDQIGDDAHRAAYGWPDKDLYQSFLENMSPVRHVLTPIRSFSVEAAKLYEDKSLDFIFIDGSHLYEEVKKDLSAWHPKLKKDGIISGHDWPQRGVKRAVREFFEGSEIRVEQCIDRQTMVDHGSCSWVISPEKKWWIPRES